MSNKRHLDHNDQVQNYHPRRSRINPPVNAENNQFDLEQKNRQPHPSGSGTKDEQNKNSDNRQEYWRKNQNYENRQLQGTSSFNPENEQKREGQKQIEQPDLINDFNGKKYKNNYTFGYKRLEELCNKEPSEIVFVISNKTNGFIDLFKQNKEPDWIFLLIKVSAKVCSSELMQSKFLY